MDASDSALRAATQCIALRIRRLSRLVTRHYEHELRETGVTLAQFILLGAVAMEQPVSPNTLARRLDLEKSTLSRNLGRLTGLKLLVSEERSGGGQLLRVTAKGLKLFQRAFPAWEKAQAEIMTRAGEDMVSLLDGMIAKMGQ